MWRSINRQALLKPALLLRNVLHQNTRKLSENYTYSATKLSDTFGTVRDLIRYATTQFNKHELVYGQCTTNAHEDAIFLVLQSLHLPMDDASLWLDAKITSEEKLNILAYISTRITQRKPTAYILNAAQFQGESLYVDENVLIPRSYIGEILANEDYFVSNETTEAMINKNGIRSILDLCTGSGCLAIHASRVFDRAEVIHATDLSPKVRPHCPHKFTSVTIYIGYSSGE